MQSIFQFKIILFFSARILIFLQLLYKSVFWQKGKRVKLILRSFLSFYFYLWKNSHSPQLTPHPLHYTQPEVSDNYLLFIPPFPPQIWDLTQLPLVGFGSLKLLLPFIHIVLCLFFWYSFFWYSALLLHPQLEKSLKERWLGAGTSAYG